MTNPIFFLRIGTAERRTPVSFRELGIRERDHLEKFIQTEPELLGEPLLMIAREFDSFDKCDKRLDLLAIDAKGKLVVIELKRDVAGSLADLQAIRYAAFCSQMTWDEVVSLRARYSNVTEEVARGQIENFIEDPEFTPLDNKPRIILAAGTFEDQELTSSVIWLRTFGVDIKCVEITPYRLSESEPLIFVPRTLIPLPEAKEMIVRTERKEARGTDLAPHQRMLQEKNEQILKYFRKLRPDREPQAARSYRFMKIGTGYGGVHFEWLHHLRAKEIEVAVHMETSSKQRNQEICGYIARHKRDIEQSVGEKVEVARNWRGQWASVYIYRTCDSWNDELAHWAAEKMAKFISVVQPLLDSFHSAPTKKRAVGA